MTRPASPELGWTRALAVSLLGGAAVVAGLTLLTLALLKFYGGYP